MITSLPVRSLPRYSCASIGLLEEGVSGDGGAKNVYVAGYEIAAKTGTSEKKGSEIRVENVKAYVCSCVAFAPADDPQIAVMIMVDEPSQGVLYGSVIAAPYIGAFLETALPYIGVERDISLDNSVKVPYLLEMSTDEAILLAESYEYRVIVKGEGNFVTNQVPKGNTLISMAPVEKSTLYCSLSVFCIAGSCSFALKPYSNPFVLN